MWRIASRPFFVAINSPVMFASAVSRCIHKHVKVFIIKTWRFLWPSIIEVSAMIVFCKLLNRHTGRCHDSNNYWHFGLTQCCNTTRVLCFSWGMCFCNLKHRLQVVSPVVYFSDKYFLTVSFKCWVISVERPYKRTHSKDEDEACCLVNFTEWV